MAETKIKILVCYHKPDVLLKDDILTPIHAGRALAEKELTPDNKDLIWMKENLIGDDTGDNISEKNKSFNEMTAIYWAWKNYDKLGNPDFIGLMHYRRHFVFKKFLSRHNECERIDENYFSKINYSPEIVQNIFKRYDFGCHIGYVDSIYSHYAENHKIQELELALEILNEKQPEYLATAKKYMKQQEGCFCNMFIFPKDMFFEYCEFIFSILFEFEKQVDLTDTRLFISERLTGIFVQRKKDLGFKLKEMALMFVKDNVNEPVDKTNHKPDSLFRKATNYYKQNGMKRTLRKIFYTLFKG